MLHAACCVELQLTKIREGEGGFGHIKATTTFRREHVGPLQKTEGGAERFVLEFAGFDVAMEPVAIDNPPTYTA
jgi:hypothetical protein